MKQVHPSYTFNASTKTITLTGLNIDQDQLLLIVNATRGVQYFNFADSSLRGAVTSGANTSVVLTDASTTGHANGDALVIYYDDQAASQAVSGTVTANPGTGAFTVSGTVGLDSASLVALENITVTVGSSVALAAGSAQVGSVTISNFPASQTIAGTVTANLDNVSANLAGVDTPRPQQGIALGYLTDSKQFFASVDEDNGLPVRIAGNSQTQSIFGTVTIGNSVTIGSLPAISGTVTANVASDQNGNRVALLAGNGDVLFGTGEGRLAVELIDQSGNSLVTAGPSLAISGTVTANLGSAGAYDSGADSIKVDMATLRGGIGPAFWLEENGGDVPISGTVTANGRSDIYDGAGDTYYNKSVIAWGNPFLGEPNLVEQSTPLPISGTVTVGNSVTIGSLPAISGTVTANVLFSADVGETMPPQAVALGFYSGDDAGIAAVNDSNRKLPISGTVTANVDQTSLVNAFEGYANSYSQQFPVGIDQAGFGDVPISGTVTVGAMPNGALTTRFGSVTTANTAQITSAVTNTSRKYLLAQNISAGTVTIGIGFSPTTTQGIQLTAGGGLTFDAFCPTGAIYWLGAVTGAAFTILEG